MIRALVGFVGLQCLLSIAGISLLRAAGLVATGARAVVLGLGAAWLAGTSAVVLGLIVLLVLGVPLTLGSTALVGFTVAGVGFGLTRRRSASVERAFGSRPASLKITLLRRGAFAAGAAYVVFGGYALARAPTSGDDARIWSLKGLALTYYGSLRPEIFLNPDTVVSHHVYPLFQPVLEAVLGRAMGQPELRLFHTELWLLLSAAIWTAGYLIWWRRARPSREQLGVALLALLALTPSVVSNISSGHADVTGAVLLAVGALAVGLWIDGGSTGHLWLGAILLAAAANTKDEDMVAVILVWLAAVAVLATRRDRGRLKPWLGAAGLCALLIIPWRLWTAAHHLSDNVLPQLPRALGPAFLLRRLPQLGETASALATRTWKEWGWLAAIFLALCLLSLASRTSQRLASFYLISFTAIAASLLWLYATTPVNLPFLIRSSLGRTVSVFMVLTPFASAHLLTRLLRPPRSE